MFMLMKIMILQDLVQGFDQETAAVVIARLTSHKMEMEVLLYFYLYINGGGFSRLFLCSSLASLNMFQTL